MSKFPVSAKAILKKFRAARAESLLPILLANGGTILTGIPQVPVVNLSGTSTNTAITAVTNILDPENTGGWTTLCEYVGAAPFYAELSRYNTNAFKLTLYQAETAGAALRMQVLVDGEVAWDAYAVADGVTTTVATLSLPGPGTSANDILIPVFCNESFEIRAARKGSLSNSSSGIYNASINFRRLR